MPKTARLALLVLVAATGALAAMHWLGGDRDPGPLAAEAGATAPLPPSTAIQNVAVGPAERSALVEPQSPEEPAALTTNLTGTFVVEDDNGAAHDRLDGEFTLLLFRGTAETRLEVRVVGGHFSIAAAGAPHDSYFVERARLGERLVACENHGRLAPRTPPLALRGRQVAPLRLRVIDRTTRVELRDVEIVASETLVHDLPHPGKAARQIARGDSPVEFEPASSSGSSVYFVRAPGYAWDSVAIDATSREVHDVRLRPGGDLDVVTSGALPRDARIHVSRVATFADGRRDGASEEVMQLVAHAPVDERGITRVVGVPAERLVVAVEIGDDRDSLALGETRATVVAGARQTVVVELRTVEAPPLVRAAGTLFMPEPWPTPEGFTLFATGATRPWHPEPVTIRLTARSPDDSLAWPWDAGTLSAGEWEAEIPALAQRLRLTVPLTGDTGLRLVAPEAARVTVRVVDAVTGDNLFDGERRHHVTGIMLDAASRHVSIGFAPHDGTWRCIAPLGRLFVRVDVDGCAPTQTPIDVRPGLADVTIHARRE